MKKKFSMLALTAALTVSSLFSFQHTTAYAQDDITGTALENEMREMIELGVLYGYGDGIYKPTLDVTRGQFAAFVHRALNLPEGEPVFTDVALSSGLAVGINSAAAAGIVSGYSPTTFEPNLPITREQAASIIDRAFTYMQIQREDAQLTVTDAGQINQNFRPAVAKNFRDEIIRGFSNGDGTYKFVPKKTATRQEAAAFISRMLHKIEEAKIPKDPGEVKEEGYKVATIQSSGELAYGTKTYTTFSEAKSAATGSNQVVTINEQIVEMPAGIVRSKPSTSATTILYKDSALTNVFTYVNAHQEMKYVDATESYVKVILAGQTFYTKHDEVGLIPLPLIDNRNYYSVNSEGDLVHTVWNVVYNKYDSYSIGPAPDYLVANQKYYSWDGSQFTNTSGQPVGTPEYQYYNYLNARTSTIYTAAEIDRYIDFKLAEVEALYTMNPTAFPYYKDATKVSKLKGLGTYLKETESKQKINALLILGIAMNESRYGTSKYAMERNNLFGLGAVDSDPDRAYTYGVPGESVDAFAMAFFNKNYYYNQQFSYGFATGNKAMGINVKYAADPFWGQKAAGHMYRADKYLGGKDFGRYRIGLTANESVNARIQPGTSSTLIYKYSNPRSAVVILASVPHTDGYNWYKVLSESPSLTQNEAYVREDLITEIPIAK